MEYDASGLPLTEAGYQVGNYHGPKRIWYPGGQLQSEYHYDNGQLHGPFTLWYENGQIEYEGQYEHTHGAGTWTYYFSDGALRGQIEYRNGSVVEASYWDEDGNPVDTMLPRSEA